MSHRLFLKNLTAQASSASWEAAIITTNSPDPVALREANWLRYFAFRTGRLVEEFEEMLLAEATKGFSAPPVPYGGGFDIPPPKSGGKLTVV